MKEVLSVSLGSTTRNHTTEAEFLGERFKISRTGTDGDFKRCLEMYKAYDGKVDAFGVGGTEFYLLVNNRRYYFREAKKIRQAIKLSKVGDGNGIKHLLEPLALQALREQGVELRGKKALKTTATDRYGLAKALVDAGCEVIFGDLIFALGIPIPIHSLRMIHILADVLLPFVTKMPFRWLYPQGRAQEKEPDRAFSRFYEGQDIIAGDFLQVWSHLPDDLHGKIIITNTTTDQNVEALQKRGLAILVTTTPRLEGRSFGTNVMEAVCWCLVDKPDPEIGPQDFKDLIESIPLKPQLHYLS